MQTETRNGQPSNPRQGKPESLQSGSAIVNRLDPQSRSAIIDLLPEELKTQADLVDLLVPPTARVVQVQGVSEISEGLSQAELLESMSSYFAHVEQRLGAEMAERARAQFLEELEHTNERFSGQVRSGRFVIVPIDS